MLYTFISKENVESQNGPERLYQMFTFLIATPYSYIKPVESTAFAQETK